MPHFAGSFGVVFRSLYEGVSPPVEFAYYAYESRTSLVDSVVH